ncbi:hypothetical protein STEG23_008064 [Scotinomys teguina]
MQPTATGKPVATTKIISSNLPPLNSSQFPSLQHQQTFHVNSPAENTRETGIFLLLDQVISNVMPLQLREPVHSLLLAMCEDQPRRRRPLQAVLEACRVHQKEVAVYPAPASLHISRLVGLVLGTISETKKGKSYLALRDLCVVLLSGQCLEVKCDMESTAGAVFNAVTSFINLGETTYFGLAYVKGEEFFFLDKDTRLCKVAPEGWREQHPKGSMDTLTLFLRIKFFVSHYELLRHSLTRHQFYLQLRKDILEERLYCNDETLLQLGVLALQAEFGSYPKEVRVVPGVFGWNHWKDDFGRRRLLGTERLCL